MRGLIVLCKTCSVLLCVLDQSRVYNSSVGPNWEQLVQLALYRAHALSYVCVCHKLVYVVPYLCVFFPMTMTLVYVNVCMEISMPVTYSFDDNVIIAVI